MGLQRSSGGDVTSLQTTVNNLQNTVNTHETEITELQNTVNSLQNTVSTNSSNINSLQTSVNNLQTSVNTNNTNITNLQSQVNSLQTSITSNTTNITNLQNTVNTLQTTVNTNTSDINALETSVSNLQNSVNTNTTNISNLQTTVNNLQTTVNNNTTNITNLQNTVNTIQNNVTTNTNNIGTLQSQVTALQNTQNLFMSHPVGGYRSHGFGFYGTAYNVAVAQSASQSTLDAFPFLVMNSSIVCDKMAIGVSAVATGSQKTDILGIYTDAGGYPGTLIATTGTIDVSTVGWKEASFSGGNVTLNSGWYWIVRLSGADTKYSGLSAANAFPIPNLISPTYDSNYDTLNGAYVGVGPHGIRYIYSSWPGSLPSTFPTIGSGAKWLCRTAYGAPWVHRIA